MLLQLEKLILRIGPTGLTALKNLREEGFEATAFEKGPTIGGLWKFNPDPNVTSALPSPNYSNTRWTMVENLWLIFN
jgi:dimethylaniline monooxygenase (N-oxide forming)